MAGEAPAPKGENEEKAKRLFSVRSQIIRKFGKICRRKRSTMEMLPRQGRTGGMIF